MKQNITLVIGDNASGKTRFLKSIIKKERELGSSIVTNMPNYRISYREDDVKRHSLELSNNELFDKLIRDNKISSNYDAYIVELMRLMYAEGDVLIIDELDSLLIPQDIIFLSAALADVRKHWKRIYVNGYDIRLLRMFTDIDTDDYTEDYTPNVFKIQDDITIIPIEEEDICEYFDTIRG